MSSYKEKLSVLSEMIEFAKVDETIKDSEYDFLRTVAEQLGVTQEDFEGLFEKEPERVIPKTEGDRILQFHRLVLLMNVDQIQEEVEVGRLHNLGLGMGLPPTAIDQVLSVMHKYPNNVVPPDVLISIFKAHYN
jgi:uncharacterized tellurite resistance protein B-like protein